MRRLKEGFYTIMKLADAVKAKGQDVKKYIIEFSLNNKIDKPVTEAIIKFKTSIDEENKEPSKIESRPIFGGAEDFGIGEDDKLTVQATAKSKKKKKGGAAGSGMSGAAALFKKKLELKLGAGEGNGDIDNTKQQQVEELKHTEKPESEID